MTLKLEIEDGEEIQEDLTELLKLMKHSEDATQRICRIFLDGGRVAEVQLIITTNQFDWIN